MGIINGQENICRFNNGHEQILKKGVLLHKNELNNIEPIESDGELEIVNNRED